MGEKLNPHKLMLLNNWVVVKPDGDIFRVTADDKNGMSLDITWAPELYPVVYGEIIGVPDEITYTGWEEAKQESKDNREVFGDRLMVNPLEVTAQKGDMAYFNYDSARSAIQQNRLIIWDQEAYIVIRYDWLLAVVRNGEFHSMNGWIYFEKIESEGENKDVETSIGYDYINQKLIHGRKRYNRQQGIVKAVSGISEMFWHSNEVQRDFYTPLNHIKVGYIIMYDKLPHDLKLENDNATHSEIAWRRTNELSVMCFWDEMGMFHLNKGRILIRPIKAVQFDGNGLLIDTKKARTTEGEVVRTSEFPLGTWFDDIKTGDSLCYNASEPSMYITIEIDGIEEELLILSPKNIIYTEKYAS